LWYLLQSTQRLLKDALARCIPSPVLVDRISAVLLPAILSLILCVMAPADVKPFYVTTHVLVLLLPLVIVTLLSAVPTGT